MVRAYRRRRTPRWLAPVLVVGAVLAVLGVMNLASGAQGGFEPQPPCEDITPPDGVKTPRTVVLLDRTGSMRGQQGAAGTAGDPVATVKHVLQDAVDAGHTVLVAGFDGSTANLHWSGSVTAYRGDTTRKTFHVRDHTDCLLQLARTAANSEPAAEGTNVLGALHAAAEQLDPDTAADSQVVVVTDGLANTGCANLDGAAFRDPEQINWIVATCRESKAIPDLQGARVQLVGIGQTGSGVASPGDEHIDWLQEVWQTLCSATDAARCDAGGQLRLGTPPPPLARDAKPDPAVRFPDIRVNQPVARTIVIELPDSMLFDFDSAKLRQDAPIDEVVGQLRRSHATNIKVEGHTDSRGTEEYNQRLSELRAQAVAAALEAHGVAVTSVDGLGESEPAVREDTGPGGRLDPRAMAKNRRVQIEASVAT